MPPNTNLPTRADFLAHSLQPCNPGETCPICTEATADTRLPCHQSHVYCQTCISAWLEQTNNCPTCRATLFQPEENDLADQQLVPERDFNWAEYTFPLEFDFANEWLDDNFGQGPTVAAGNAHLEEIQPDVDREDPTLVASGYDYEGATDPNYFAQTGSPGDTIERERYVVWDDLFPGSPPHDGDIETFEEFEAAVIDYDGEIMDEQE